MASVRVCVLSPPDDAELRVLQSSKHDVSSTLKFFQGGKLGLRGNMRLDHFHDELEIRDGLLVHVDKNDPLVVGKVVPRCAWPRVLEFFHAGPSVNHLGHVKVIERMRNAVWWPSMDADVRQ